MLSTSRCRTALMMGALALSMNLSAVAEASRYGNSGSRGGDAFSGRYERYLEEEAKREKAKAQRALELRQRLQKAGEPPVVPGASEPPAHRSAPLLFDRRNQHNRGQ